MGRFCLSKNRPPMPTPYLLMGTPNVRSMKDVMRRMKRYAQKGNDGN